MVNNGRDLPTEGRFAGGEHRFPIRVYFEDTDLLGIVYHANYLCFMERSRSDMLRLVGVDQRGVMEAGGGAYAVARLNIRFLAPARLDDALVVVSRLLKVHAAHVVIHQRVMRGEAVLTEAEVVAALVAPGGRPRRQPADWIARYKNIQEQEHTTPGGG